jgi:hypothetical protein
VAEDRNGERPGTARREAAGVSTGRGRDPDPRESGGKDGDGGDPPRIVATVGQAGVYLAVGSLGVAAVGVAAIAAGVQPYGNVATVLALAGVTVAMALGTAHQAYVGDYWADE